MNLGGRVWGGRGKRGEDREEKVEPTKAGGKPMDQEWPLSSLFIFLAG